jgi:SPP1 family predicted phage head-tail adaptor
MYSTSCKLRLVEPQYNSFGARIEDKVTETEIPILRIEQVRATEFYKANEQGYRPSLRLRIANLNYNNEQELEYNNTIYTIIRTEDYLNDMLLICERKIKNA